MAYPIVTPAKAGVQSARSEPIEEGWIPAFAGMTAERGAR
jgi:hypothetical protein